MSYEVLQRLRQHFGEAVLASHDYRGDETATLDPSALRAACLWLRDSPDLAFSMLSDLTAVDRLEQRIKPRFEVVYHLYSVSHKHRLRLKVGTGEPAPEVDTTSDIWRNADWLEREVWDMYGIRFSKHPDLRRILLYEQFEGHPLRKDYPKERRQPLSRRPPDEIEAVLACRPPAGGRSLL